MTYLVWLLFLLSLLWWRWFLLLLLAIINHNTVMIQLQRASATNSTNAMLRIRVHRTLCWPWGQSLHFAPRCQRSWNRYHPERWSDRNQGHHILLQHFKHVQSQAHGFKATGKSTKDESVLDSRLLKKLNKFRCSGTVYDIVFSGGKFIKAHQKIIKIIKDHICFVCLL